jgi:dihydrofolate reductase
MRRLKLQMQMTTDGFVAGPEGQLAWMTTEAGDERLIGYINQLADTSDTILMGRKMTPGFVQYWEAITKRPDSPEYGFAKKMVDTPKIVFSRTVKEIAGKNVRVENGDFVAAINRLKGQAGKDLIVYGGASFVASLIEARLIDELNFFVNPVAIGEGMRIFRRETPLTLSRSTTYPSGIVVNTYRPR